MKKLGCYRTAHLIEDQFEPVSRGRVLRNLLHIKRRREMDVLEAEKYALALPILIGHIYQDSLFHCSRYLSNP